MGRANLKFGGGVAASVLNPFVLAIIILAGILICVLPRNKAVVSFLAAALLIPTDQILLIGPAHFPMLRILVVFGFARIFKDKTSSKRALFGGGINKIDWAVILLTIFTAINGILLFQESGAVINQLGVLYTVFGVYFILRFLIRDEEDIVSAIRALIYITIFVAIVMTYEVTTGHNPYAILGGARASFYGSLVQREDRFRAQGPFAHSILAGTFGAVLVPLFMALWWKGKKHHKWVVIGIIAATIVTLACNSSTPILGYGAGVVALCAWFLRRQMRIIRWATLFALLGLHLSMKGPVWSLIAKIDITGGSSSWHRYRLVDLCIRHFWDWWLVGVKDTSVWGWDMWDTANQYVSTCENSGLLPFLLFLAILIYGFKYLGKARRKAENRNSALFLWALGSALFANCVAFFGISYFDQTQVSWYCLLAIICAATVIPASKKSQTMDSSAVADLVSRFEESHDEDQGIDVSEPQGTIVPMIARIRPI